MTLSAAFLNIKKKKYEKRKGDKLTLFQKEVEC